jgi:hypothetical protein
MEPNYEPAETEPYDIEAAEAYDDYMADQYDVERDRALEDYGDELEDVIGGLK